MGHCRLPGDNPIHRKDKGFRARLHPHRGTTHHPHWPVCYNLEMAQREGTMKVGLSEKGDKKSHPQPQFLKNNCCLFYDKILVCVI
jgi:hypothetical protein